MRAREKRDSLGAADRQADGAARRGSAAHRLIWHDLEAERHAIERAIPNVAAVWGAQDTGRAGADRARLLGGDIAELATKPVIAGAGCNFQRACWWAIFLGIGFKFRDFIQAIHRIQRFLQPHQCGST
jgi:hypothetical protein